jgi:17beta-estradiol 17-dehydrogenase / very-long-chain 3-oxoacyl-CoA reductase
MRRLRKAVKGLDVGVLVNNAGVAKPGAVFLHEADAEAWVRMIRVNLWAVTEVTAAVLPGMVERGRGAVVNMGSASSGVPSFPLHTMYSATKRYVSAIDAMDCTIVQMQHRSLSFQAELLAAHEVGVTCRYVAQFSRSLYVEYKSKGIDVQCHVCNVTLTDSRSAAVHSELLSAGPLNFNMCLRKRFLLKLIHGTAVMPRTVALHMHMRCCKWRAVELQCYQW